MLFLSLTVSAKDKKDSSLYEKWGQPLQMISFEKIPPKVSLIKFGYFVPLSEFYRRSSKIPENSSISICSLTLVGFPS
jgi:hypothetical protein